VAVTEGPDWRRIIANVTRAEIWAAWNALPDDETRPVHAIADRLALSVETVAAVVYPPDVFGPWEPGQEP
jgi:hypothetical protein